MTARHIYHEMIPDGVDAAGLNVYRCHCGLEFHLDFETGEAIVIRPGEGLLPSPEQFEAENKRVPDDWRLDTFQEFVSGLEGK